MIALTADIEVSCEWADEESRLIEQARTTPTAFGPLYEHYFARIYRYCTRRVQNAQEAEDLTSLIFTRALSNLRHYRGGSFAAWLFQIAHNAIANHRRDQRSQFSLEQAEQVSSGDSTLDDLIDLDEFQCVARLIATLSDDQRELLALRIAGELSAKEIGVVLGKSEGAVRVALHRIIQQLRTGYEQAQKE